MAGVPDRQGRVMLSSLVSIVTIGLSDPVRLHGELWTRLAPGQNAASNVREAVAASRWPGRERWWMALRLRLRFRLPRSETVEFRQLQRVGRRCQPRQAVLNVSH